MNVGKINIPYVSHDRDRHGNDRWYYRRKGRPKVRLPGQPGSPEFAEALEAAKTAAPERHPVVAVVPPDSFQFLCNLYFGSTFFHELSAESRTFHRGILNGLCKTLGDKPYAKMLPRHIEGWMDARRDRPEAANNLRKALARIFKFAKARRLVHENPTLGIAKVKTFTEGFHTWTIPEVAQYLAHHHQRGTNARRAMVLALFTGLRRKDLARIGRANLSDGKLLIRVSKARRRKNALLELPVLGPLRDEINSVPANQMMFMESARGRAYSAASLGNMFRAWCDEAGLKGCTLHGLRKAGAVLAAEAGASDQQLMAMYGWAKADMAGLYTAQANQSLLAQAGMAKMEQLLDMKCPTLFSGSVPPPMKSNG